MKTWSAAKASTSARQDERPWQNLDVVIFEIDDSVFMAGDSAEGWQWLLKTT